MSGRCLCLKKSGFEPDDKQKKRNLFRTKMLSSQTTTSPESQKDSG